MTTNWSTTHLLEVMDRLFHHYEKMKADKQLLSTGRLLEALSLEPAIEVNLRDIRKAHEHVVALWGGQLAAFVEEFNKWQVDNKATIPRSGDPEVAAEQAKPLVLGELKTLRQRFAELKRMRADLGFGTGHGFQSASGLPSMHEFRMSAVDCGVALEEIDDVVAKIAREPNYGQYPSHKDDRWIGGLFDEALIDEPNETVRWKAESVVEDVRTLRTELALRIGRAASRRHLVDRYAKRCEAFHADRLRTLASKKKGTAEAELVLDFAEFLFDAGIDVASNAEISDLMPDLLSLNSTSPFYCEAKQYAGSWSKPALLKAIAQVWSTWHALRPTHPHLNEAFWVVFRSEGTSWSLPTSLSSHGMTMHLRLIDISENKTRPGTRTGRGSNAQTTKTMTEADIFNEIHAAERTPTKQSKGNLAKRRRA